MNLAEALAITHAGWRSEEEHRIYLAARDFVLREGREARDREVRRLKPIECWGVISDRGEVIQCYAHESLARDHAKAAGFRAAKLFEQSE